MAAARSARQLEELMARVMLIADCSTAKKSGRDLKCERRLLALVDENGNPTAMTVYKQVGSVKTKKS